MKYNYLILCGLFLAQTTSVWGMEENENNRGITPSAVQISTSTGMKNVKVVSKEEWLEARRKLLAKEKEFTRLRDQLNQQRRELPWEKVEKEYVFTGPKGRETLSGLFNGKSQLIVYHFMFAPEWEEGCSSCSFWADNFNGIDVHLQHRDTNFVVISRAPYEKLETYEKRMGWNFKWLSSFENEFNYDFHVSFTKEQLETKALCNYEMRKPFMGT